MATLTTDNTSNIKPVYVCKASIQGRRPHQEDRIFCCNIINEFKKQFDCSCLNKCSRLSLFLVCDGHAGARAAQFCCDNIIKKFWEATASIGVNSGTIDILNIESLKLNLKSILELTVTMLDKDYLCRAKGTKEKDGSCITAALLLNNHFFFLNVGDCRAMRVNKGSINQITRDHQPGLNKKEDKRVLDAGGKISDSRNDKRVLAKGMRMAITRAIGDRLLKPLIIICNPDLFYVQVTPDLQYIILCSDGITSRMTNKHVLETLKKSKMKTKGMQTNRINYAKDLVDFSYSKGSMDNISALVLEML